MANTYSQLNIHCVFAVKGRENVLDRSFRYDLFKYMAGIIKNDGAFPLAVNGWSDHVHVFFELPPHMSVAKQMQMLKSTSSKWINDRKLLPGLFRWQEGYGAFSYSRSQRDSVIKYIERQEDHHTKQTFRQEYINLLEMFEIDFNEHYIFQFID